MHVASSEEIMTNYLEENPARWLEITFKKIDDLITEYNKVAVDNSEMLIGAFAMTPEEYEEVITLAKDEDSSE